MDVLRGPFDPDTHRETFVHYFEVVMAPDGTVVYAVPGHVEVLERIASNMGVGDCPRERWWDYLDWLMEQTGYICLWTNGIMGNPNETQRERINELVRQGIMET